MALSAFAEGWDETKCGEIFSRRDRTLIEYRQKENIWRAHRDISGLWARIAHARKIQPDFPYMIYNKIVKRKLGARAIYVCPGASTIASLTCRNYDDVEDVFPLGARAQHFQVSSPSVLCRRAWLDLSVCAERRRRARVPTARPCRVDVLNFKFGVLCEVVSQSNKTWIFTSFRCARVQKQQREHHQTRTELPSSEFKFFIHFF